MRIPVVPFFFFLVITTVSCNDGKIIPDDAIDYYDIEESIQSRNDGLEHFAGKAVTYPCTCKESKCSCCSGNILQNFNITMTQRVCSHVTYDPDDTAFGVRIVFNNRVLYQREVSGKNPPPVCVPIPRLTSLKICLRFNNVYIIGRNVHACLTLETQWKAQTGLSFTFDCIRLGANGVALLKPEEGGGLPVGNNPSDLETDGIEDYDENVTDPDKPPRKKKQ